MMINITMILHNGN